MRRLSLLAPLGLALLLPGAALGEPLSKPLRAVTPAAAGGTIVLENLSGLVAVVAGQGTEAVLTGTAYSEADSPSASQALLDAVAVEVRGGGSRAALHVAYPVEKAPFRSDADTCLSIARIRPRPFEVTWLERHFKHTQVFLPLNNQPYAVVLAPPTAGPLPDLV